MQRKYIRIVGHDDLRRDPESNGIVNTDNNALNKYREERELKRKLTKMVEEHEALKGDIDDIKKMLHQLLGK